MSDEQKQNGGSKPEDFLLPQFYDVTLPSGMKARLRRPSIDMWILFGSLPARLVEAAKAEASGEPNSESQVAPEEALRWSHHVLCYLFVTPRFSTSGEPGTFHPSQLRTPDRAFLQKWEAERAREEMGESLVEFLRQPPELDSAGPGSETLRESSQ